MSGISFGQKEEQVQIMLVDNRSDYISNFNWLSNWIDIYFFNKVTDFVLGLNFLILIIFSLFFKKN
jgi:hypothetical protein